MINIKYLKIKIGATWTMNHEPWTMNHEAVSFKGVCTVHYSTVPAAAIRFSPLSDFLLVKCHGLFCIPKGCVKDWSILYYWLNCKKDNEDIMSDCISFNSHDRDFKRQLILNNNLIFGNLRVSTNIWLTYITAAGWVL